MDNKQGGYDFDFVSKPPDVLTCLICTLLAKNPHQMDCCGRIYCQLCLSEHKKHSEECPHCRQTGNSFVDKRSDKEIKALKVKCTNETDGCTWVNELSCLEEHLKSCDYTLVSCDNECLDGEEVAKLLRKDLQSHLEDECPRRQIECTYCHETGEYQERMGTHLDTCPYVSTDCPNEECHKRFPRVNAAQHAEVCDYQPVTCKYAEVGCEETPLRKDIKKHEEDDHLITSETVLKLRQDLKGLESKIDDLHQVCEESVLHKDLRKHEETNQLHFQNATKAILTLKQDLKALKSRIDEQNEEECYTFVVTNFQQFKKGNTRFISPKFYSKGYRMRLEIQAEGEGRGTHVSVYIYFEKGRYDDCLTWPFTETVAIELLNHLEDKNHYKKRLKYSADAGKRVLSDENKHGWGFCKFIAHSDLNHKPDTNCQYLKNDTLVFRVAADVPDYKPWLCIR